MNKMALIVALLAALAGLFLLWLYKQRFEKEASGGPPTSVVVATQDIPLGTALSQDMLGVRDLPQAYVEERHVRASDVRRIIGVRVSSAVKANESVLWSDLATTTDDRRDLSSLVPSGMRAITVEADQTSSFGGLLRAGDRVDVLLTTARGDGQRTTMALLQNLLVLAAGRDTGGQRRVTAEDERENGRSYNVSEVTLAVTIEQGQLLTLSGTLGRITLELRNSEDITVIDRLPEATPADIIEVERRIILQRRQRPPQQPAQQQPEGGRLPERVE